MARSFRGYEIEKKIGSGGMATLYLGIQKALNRQVAIKMLHPGLADDESFITRFEREARTASSIGHRNIVAVFDFGVEDDIYYIVMELVRGLDLKQVMAESGPFPPEIVLATLEEICYGLEAAHKQGVIHRDIKPGNVMLSEDGEVKVADFGLARESSDIARMSSLTLPGSVLGTPAYMSPEQATGKEIDHRTDIFSLGVMAFELLTGDKPFQGVSYSEIRDQIINSDPPRLMGRAPVTEEFERLVHRMMQRDPDRRFPSMRHVIRAIEDCMEMLDPTGGLIKYRRKYLTKFAQDPKGFGEELKSAAISAHLDRGFYFKQMGLAKIDDATQEFRFVLSMDPDNSKASRAMAELEREAEESGVRLPEAPPEADATEEHPATRQLSPPESETASAGPTPEAIATAPSSGVADPTPAPSSHVTDPEDASEATRVIGTESSAGPMRTQILSPEESGLKVGPAPKRSLTLPIAIAAAVVVLVALFLWKPWAGGGPTGALVLSSEPAGATVLVRGPGETDFRATGQATSCRVEELEAGTWEVRFEFEGFKPTVRRVPVADDDAPLHVALTPLVTDGRFELSTTPPGATVRIKRPSDPEFTELAGVTPLTSDLIDAGMWEIQAELPGTGVLTRNVRLEADGTLPLAWNLETDHDRGRIAVTSEPSGASIRLRRKGTRSYTRTGRSTPATLDSLSVGEWEVRLDKSQYARIVRAVLVERDALAQLDVVLKKQETAPPPPPPPPPAKDGYAMVVVSPFADVYLDGRLFASEQRRTVVPLSSNKPHQIELRHRTFGTKLYADVNAAPGDTVDLGLHRFEWSTVRVYCRPGVPADLIIDGTQIERQTPYSDKIVSGKHTFLVRKEGFVVSDVIVVGPDGAESHPPRTPEGEAEVRVPSAQEVRIQFVLEKATP